MKTASQIVSGMSDFDLALVLNDIANDHLDRGAAQIPALLALEERVMKENTMSKGVAILTAKEAALVEASSRWLRGMGL